jgi:hypothetical protein
MNEPFYTVLTTPISLAYGVSDFHQFHSVQFAVVRIAFLFD